MRSTWLSPRWVCNNLRTFSICSPSGSSHFSVYALILGCTTATLIQATGFDECGKDQREMLVRRGTKNSSNGRSFLHLPRCHSKTAMATRRTQSVPPVAPSHLYHWTKIGVPLNVLPRFSQGKANPQWSCNFSKAIQLETTGKYANRLNLSICRNFRQRMEERTPSHTAAAIKAPLINTVAITPKGCALAIQ